MIILQSANYCTNKRYTNKCLHNCVCKNKVSCYLLSHFLRELFPSNLAILSTTRNYRFAIVEQPSALQYTTMYTHYRHSGEQTTMKVELLHKQTQISMYQAAKCFQQYEIYIDQQNEWKTTAEENDGTNVVLQIAKPPSCMVVINCSVIYNYSRLCVNVIELRNITYNIRLTFQKNKCNPTTFACACLKS